MDDKGSAQTPVADKLRQILHEHTTTLAAAGEVKAEARRLGVQVAELNRVCFEVEALERELFRRGQFLWSALAYAKRLADAAGPFEHCLRRVFLRDDSLIDEVRQKVLRLEAAEAEADGGAS